MRIGYSENEDFPGQFFLWQANCDRSLSGKAGQRSLRELEAALLALPTKRLVEGEVDNGVDCCAVGALARYKQITPVTRFPDENMEEVGVECGMPRMVAWKVVEMNDVEFGSYARSLTPEQRYHAVLDWVRYRIAAPATTQEEKP